MVTTTQDQEVKMYTPTCPPWCNYKRCSSKYADFRDVFHRSEAVHIEGRNGARISESTGLYVEMTATSHTDGTPAHPAVSIPMDCLTGLSSSIEVETLTEVDELVAAWESALDKLYEWRDWMAKR